MSTVGGGGGGTALFFQCNGAPTKVAATFRKKHVYSD
jgi:hypothetical protein